MSKEHEAISLLCEAGQNLVRGTNDLGHVLADVCDFIKENVNNFPDHIQLLALMEKVNDASKACKMKQDDTIAALRKAKEILLND